MQKRENNKMKSNQSREMHLYAIEVQRCPHSLTIVNMSDIISVVLRFLTVYKREGLPLPCFLCDSILCCFNTNKTIYTVL